MNKRFDWPTATASRRLMCVGLRPTRKRFAPCQLWKTPLQSAELSLRLVSFSGGRGGLRRRHVFYDGKFHDLLELAMFRDDVYQAPRPAMQVFLADWEGVAP